MFKKVDREINRQKKHSRIRAKITGTPERPRLSVFRSLENISVQVIDDVNGVTLVAASTLDKEVKEAVKYGGNIEASKAVGAVIAKRAIEKGIKQVVFSELYDLDNYGLILMLQNNIDLYLIKKGDINA